MSKHRTELKTLQKPRGDSAETKNEAKRGESSQDRPGKRRGLRGAPEGEGTTRGRGESCPDKREEKRFPQSPVSAAPSRGGPLRACDSGALGARGAGRGWQPPGPRPGGWASRAPVPSLPSPAPRCPHLAALPSPPSPRLWPPGSPGPASCAAPSASAAASAPALPLPPALPGAPRRHLECGTGGAGGG